MRRTQGGRENGDEFFVALSVTNPRFRWIITDDRRYFGRLARCYRVGVGPLILVEFRSSLDGATMSPAMRWRFAALHGIFGSFDLSAPPPASASVVCRGFPAACLRADGVRHAPGRPPGRPTDHRIGSSDSSRLRLYGVSAHRYYNNAASDAVLLQWWVMMPGRRSVDKSTDQRLYIA